MDSKPKMKAVDFAIQKNGFYIVFLTRLSPLFPFPLLNYGFGATMVLNLSFPFDSHTEDQNMAISTCHLFRNCTSNHWLYLFGHFDAQFTGNLGDGFG